MGIEFFGAQDNPNAIVIRSSARVKDIEFFSPTHFPQQIGLMSRPTGYLVPSHLHNEISREIRLTQEVLMIRKGKCEVVLYHNNSEQARIELDAGDVILLASGGHSIRMLEDCEILEVKQGPYLGPDDKIFI
jgi:oxalate decarboxylase/phosphoglucose isomerase-like protein (cupin superfamily)